MQWPIIGDEYCYIDENAIDQTTEDAINRIIEVLSDSPKDVLRNKSWFGLEMYNRRDDLGTTITVVCELANI